MTDNLKLVIGTIASGVMGFLASSFNWIRFKTKDKADVRKVESEIKSSEIEDEVKISKQALEWTVNFAVQLDKANVANDKLQVEIERLRALNEKIHADYNAQIMTLEKAVAEQKQHCTGIQYELDKLKSQYGITN